MNCSDFEAEELMTKRDIFILLDTSSPNISSPPITEYTDDSTAANADILAAAIFPWKRYEKQQRQTEIEVVEEPEEYVE
eukprot:8885161-Ditylum_brightwellii.AAC.1